MSELASRTSTVVWQFSLLLSSLRSWLSFDFSLFHFILLFVRSKSVVFIVFALFITCGAQRRLTVAGMQSYCARKLSAVVNEEGVGRELITKELVLRFEYGAVSVVFLI